MNNLTRIYTESPMLQALVSTTVIYGGLAEGVSGSELREWLVSESEPDGRANGIAEAESAVSDARIAELVRQRDAAIDMYEGLLRDVYEGLLRDVGERYLKLPVDADGVPIRIGDMVGLHGDTLVNSMTFDGKNWYVSEAVISSDWVPAHNCRHVKPRTIEDVLREYRRDLIEGEAV